MFIVSATLQDGAAGDDCLQSAAATDDGGVVVGGYSNGTYNGVASKGLVDFTAIKIGASVYIMRVVFRACALHYRRCCRRH